MLESAPLRKRASYIYKRAEPAVIFEKGGDRAKPRNVAIGRLRGPSAERPGKGERSIVDDPG